MLKAGVGRVALSKWYLDCVTPGGDTAIVYAGRVALGSVTIPYLEILADTVAGSRVRWRRATSRIHVEQSGASIALGTESLPVSGRWTPRSDEIAATLFDDERGRIEWH